MLIERKRMPNQLRTMSKPLPEPRGSRRAACVQALLVIGVLLMSGCLAPASSSGQDVAAKIDQYLATLTKERAFMGAALVARNGKVMLAKGYGMANVEYDLPNTPQSKFDIGSISKTFTSTLVLLLQEQGKLSVEEPICKYLDDCPAAWRELTIQHLLTHTSGILNYTELPDYFATRALESFMPEAITRIKAMPLQFKPGSRYSYSNTNYKLLIKLVEKVSGKPYREVLQERILDPLNMRDTGVFEQPGYRHIILKNRSTGYTDGTGVFENAPWVHPSNGGGMYSTVEDLYLWDQALYGEKVLSSKSLKAAFTPFKGDYGYGWFILYKNNHKLIVHGGNTPGYSCTFSRYPDDHVSIILMSNLDTSRTDQFSPAIAAMIFGDGGGSSK
jgi:CubicO group peptidase (beta-lactamase class C family)